MKIRYAPLGIQYEIRVTPTDWTTQEIRFMLQSCARDLMPDERVADCLRFVPPVFQYVEVHKTVEGNKAYFKHLAVCGSVWHCPVCSAKIGETRRQELQAAINKWRGGMFMATYTVSHHRKMTLKETLDAVGTAYRSTKAGKAYQTLKVMFGVVGSVRALEITHGKNGWHPHIHELVFTDRKLSDADLQYVYRHLYSHWVAALKKSGHWASAEHGIDVTSASSWIADYIAKFGHEPVTQTWDVSHEIAKQASKKAHTPQGDTPFQLLYRYLMDDNKAGEQFQEYAATMKGRQQLVWTVGLRDRLGIGIEQSDGELAEETPDESILLAQLTRKQWRAILVSKNRAELLKQAVLLEKQAFQEWLDDLVEYYTAD